jgi:hypothetical protein
MQVSTIAELDTHAVIGGGQAQAFGMSDSAEFFTVLSDTLYRDKKRAVAREVVCNAWDAHIMVGKTDVPVEITLNEKELIIKDFGPGIAKDKIGPVYCVYGASTKVKDDKQTGGFGLGCKAPFAYSDHFTVTSCIDGFRTLWAISRGGAATDGKPDFRPMVSVPSQETGITVSIPIKDEKDVEVFKTLLREICRNGGILARLNGVEIPRYDYTEARKNGFCVVSRAGINSFRESRGYVLYGTVLYPITTTDYELMSKVDSLDNLVENNGRVILIAAPNSIGVQPSREGLSYSELTTATLHRMLDNAIKRLKNIGPNIARKLYREEVRSSLKDRNNIALATPKRPNDKFEGLLSDPVVIAERAVREKLGHYLNHQAMSKIAYCEMQKKWPNERRFFRRARHSLRHNFRNDNLVRSRKLHLRLASKLGVLGKLLVFQREYSYARWSAKSIDEAGFREGHLQDRIIVAPTRKAVDALLRKDVAELAKTDRHNADEIACHWRVPALVLQNPSDKLLESIIDLADRFKIKVELLDFPKRKKAQKASAGYIGLNDLARNVRGYNWRATKMSVVQPKAYLMASGHQENLDIGRFSHDSEKSPLKRLNELFPDIAVIWTVKQHAKMKALKVPSLDEVLAKEIDRLSDSREVQYATMMHNCLFIADGRYSTPIANMIARFCKGSMKISQFFFPARFKSSNGADVQRMTDLLTIAEHIRSHGSQKKTSEAALSVTEKASEAFKHLTMPSSEIEKKFRYLKPLTMVNYYNNDTEADVLLDMIRFLARRAAKAQSASTSINNDMKEAA